MTTSLYHVYTNYIQTFDTDRGLFNDPHTVALCLATRNEIGVGDIRSTAEAPRPVVYYY
jgi:hypothetical protein